MNDLSGTPDDLECSVWLQGILHVSRTSQGWLSTLIQHVLGYSSTVHYIYICLWINNKWSQNPRRKFPIFKHLVKVKYAKGLSRPLLLHISSAHAIHWSRASHVIFKRAHRFENSTKHRADDLCVNLVCEYFCWMLSDPHFFSADHFLFWLFTSY